ncbi:MAG: hypothetical protein JXR13_17965 [Thalassovita sp.]
MSARGKSGINAKTRREATQINQLPMGHTSLIGTLLTPKGPTAYVQLSPGRVLRVNPGDRVDGATVTQIDDGVIMMARGDDIRRLRMPGH